MHVRLRERAMQISLGIGRQIDDLRQTWTEDLGARRGALWALLAGVSVVGIAIVVDVLRYLDVHSYRARFLSLTTERGLPELVMDALVLLAAVLTARLFLRTGLRGFLFLAGLLSFIAVDDFFALHESFGIYVAGQLESPEIAGISANAWGELAFVILFGLVCIPFLLWAVWGGQPENLTVLVLYGVLFALFVAFAVGVDVLHSLAQSPFMDRLMGWIEDGGEVLIMTSVSVVSILQWRGRLHR